MKQPLSLTNGIRYGALALPLAFLALPLYVNLPSYYASQFGVSLAALGAVLLLTRGLDAVSDPLIGTLIDRLMKHAPQGLLWLASGAAATLALGFTALFFPPVTGSVLLGWLTLSLLVTYLAFSVLSVLHQSWGASWGGSPAQRALIVSWREGFALGGVVLGSLLPALAGMAGATATLVLLLGLGLFLLRRAPGPERGAAAARPAPVNPPPRSKVAWHLPWRSRAFRALLGVYMLNGIASAIPATLVLFFVRDRLELPQAEPVFLAAYFVAAALSLPLWIKTVRRYGLVPTWLMGMALAVLAFSSASLLGAGELGPFLLVCLLSGVALGADLAVPGALLVGVIHQAEHGGQYEGVYLGWWTLASKLNLALAAGAALPLLQLLGYSPGTREPTALQALTAAYVLLPCLLKVLAGALLWRQRSIIQDNP